MSYLIPRQMVQDELRRILFTRSEKGTINVYDLGTNGQAMNRVTTITTSAIVQSAANIARTVDRSCFKPLVCIAPVESSESTITSHGVRLYFSTLYWRSFGEATSSILFR